MGICYDQAGEDVHEMARRVMADHHRDLQLGEDKWVRLCILMAYRDDTSDEPPVKCHGIPAAAVISIIPYKQRADKRAAAEIVIDQKRWEELDERKRLALLDHEITHIQFQKDEDDCVKTDDTGQPKLKLRQHDWDLGGFREICQRWGPDALEGVAARDFFKNYGDAVSTEEKLFS